MLKYFCNLLNYGQDTTLLKYYFILNDKVYRFFQTKHRLRQTITKAPSIRTELGHNEQEAVLLPRLLYLNHILAALDAPQVFGFGDFPKSKALFGNEDTYREHHEKDHCFSLERSTLLLPLP